MTSDNPSADSTLEVVSARFADLVAQDYQNRQLDQITKSFFAVNSEDMLSTALVQGLTQRGGVRQASYYRHLGDGIVGALIRRSLRSAAFGDQVKHAICRRLVDIQVECAIVVGFALGQLCGGAGAGCIQRHR